MLDCKNNSIILHSFETETYKIDAALMTRAFIRVALELRGDKELFLLISYSDVMCKWQTLLVIAFFHVGYFSLYRYFLQFPPL